DGIFAVTLKADEESPFKPQSDEEKAADEKKKDDTDKKDDKKSTDEKKDEKKEKKKEKKEEPIKPIQVDLDGIGNRVAPVPLPAAILSGLAARKDKFFYLTTPQEARQFGADNQQKPHNVLHVYDVTKREDKVLLEGIEGYDLDKEGKKLIYKAGPVYGVIEPAPGKKVGEGKLELGGLQVQVDPREEWRQIFHEAWRIERDFYWDPAMTGHDWKQIGNR